MRGKKRTYHESILFPSPKSDFVISLQRRDSMNALYTFYSDTINPESTAILKHEFADPAVKVYKIKDNNDKHIFKIRRENISSKLYITSKYYRYLSLEIVETGKKVAIDKNISYFTKKHFSKMSNSLTHRHVFLVKCPYPWAKKCGLMPVFPPPPQLNIDTCITLSHSPGLIGLQVHRIGTPGASLRGLSCIGFSCS